MAADPIRTLRSFRVGLYRCFTGWADTLFELCDAVVCSPASVHSVPSLSLEPVFRRGHGSLYKALDRGGIDTDQLRRLLVTHLPEPGVGPRVFAVDASTWDRCDAETSPERGFYYSASKHSTGQPIVAGWNYQWINQLCFTPDSWTAPADVTRIAPADTHTDATVAQIRQLFTFLPDEQHAPMFMFDAGYDPITIGHDLADINAQILCRICDDRVFHIIWDAGLSGVGWDRVDGRWLGVDRSRIIRGPQGRRGGCRVAGSGRAACWVVLCGRWRVLSW